MVPMMSRVNGNVCIQYAEEPANPLDMNALNALGSGRFPVFLSPIVQGVPGGVTVSFDVQGTFTLDELLRNGVTEAQLRGILLAIRSMLQQGTSEGMLLKNVVLDERLVYVNQATGDVSFIYLPFDGIPADVRAMRAFFESVGNVAKPVDAGAKSLLDRYNQYFMADSSFSPFGMIDMLSEICVSQPAQSAQVSQPAHAAQAAQSQTAAPTQDEIFKTVSEQDAFAAMASRAQSYQPSTQSQPFQAASSTPQSFQPADQNQTFQEAGPVDVGTTVLSDFSNPVETTATTTVTTSAPVAGETTLLSETATPTPIATAQPTPTPAPKPVYKLHRRANNETCIIDGPRFVVGKSKYSDFQVKGTTTVSRSHAIFSVDDSGCWVEDDGSTNGTFVNDEELPSGSRRLLDDGDRLVMSDEEFVFEVIEG